ncbi:MAG TPA: ABC transporter substrate-binding protein [Thermomicrobiales bacterium]
MNRRRFVSMLALSPLLPAAGARAQGTPAPAGAFKIGVLNPTTGQFAVFGEQVNTGIRLYFDGIGNAVDGTAIELVFADTAGDPQQALDQARRLVQEERVDLLMGTVNSAVVPPLADFAGQEQVPLVVTVGGARVVTGPDRNPFVFRTAMANGQQDRVLGWYTAERLGKQRAATFAWDFLVGEERVGGFAETFAAAGGEVVAQQKPPLGTTDYGPFISQVDPGSVDVLYAFFAGPGALAFVQQLREFGLTPDLQVVAADYFTAGVLDQMGEDAIGLIQAGAYTPALETAENQAFIEAYQAAGNEGLPGVYVEEGYTCALVIAEAIRAAGGGGKQALLDALAATQVTGPAGPLTFDERGQAVRTCYITRVEETDEGLAQVVLETVENVTQDWTP